MGTRGEADALERFGQWYAGCVPPAAVAAERDSLGSDYGANGYTTLAQADQLVEVLALDRGDRLLDIGSGCGWPGLHVAARAGCTVVVSDLIQAGMRRAVARASRDGPAVRTAAVVASARHLPFRPDSFEAIVHADVLC